MAAPRPQPEQTGSAAPAAGSPPPSRSRAEAVLQHTVDVRYPSGAADPGPLPQPQPQGGIRQQAPVPPRLRGPPAGRHGDTPHCGALGLRRGCVPVTLGPGTRPPTLLSGPGMAFPSRCSRQESSHLSHLYTLACAHTCTHMHATLRTHMSVRTQHAHVIIHVDACMHTHLGTQTYSHANVRTHARLHMCVLSSRRSLALPSPPPARHRCRGGEGRMPV